MLTAMTSAAGRRPGPEAEHDQQRRGHLADVGAVGQRGGQAGPGQLLHHEARPVDQLGDAMEQDQRAQRHAQHQLAQIVARLHGTPPPTVRGPAPAAGAF